MDLCLNSGDPHAGALHQLHEQLKQLLGTADQLHDSALAAHICHAMEQAERSILRTEATRLAD